MLCCFCCGGVCLAAGGAGSLVSVVQAFGCLWMSVLGLAVQGWVLGVFVLIVRQGYAFLRSLRERYLVFWATLFCIPFCCSYISASLFVLLCLLGTPLCFACVLFYVFCMVIRLYTASSLLPFVSTFTIIIFVLFSSWC